MDERTLKIKTAAGELQRLIGTRKPSVGIILGSGLDSLGEQIADAATVPFTSLPGFPSPTALGHKGNFVCGILEGKCVLVMQGRYHCYEGLDMDTITLPVRVMAELGIKTLLVSNASGGCNTSYALGDLILIRDHINRLPNALIGPNLEAFGPRFPDMTCAYDNEYQRVMMKIAEDEGILLKRGVYMANTGPSYETPAENRFFRAVGADIVGMSTVPEVIAARHCGIRVLGISVVSDIAPECKAGQSGQGTDGEEVLRIAEEASARMARLCRRFVAREG